MSKTNGWIGVDLDGTLAHYGEFIAIDHIGEPIKPMVDRVKGWLKQGIEVPDAGVTKDNRDPDFVRAAIEAWCITHIGAALEVTNMKDFGMIELWDDRAIQVDKNSGKQLGPSCFDL